MSARWLPIEELKFAARSGFLTHDLWVRFFAGNHDRSWNSRRWHRLIRDKWFVMHPSLLSPKVIVPNVKNIQVQCICVSGIEMPPYIAQLKHDEILYEGLLQLKQKDVLREFVSDCDLRRAEMFGSPRKANVKLPDAIVTLKNGSLLAIEVELTQKSLRRYREVMSAYKRRENISAILIVAPHNTVLKGIFHAANHEGFDRSRIPIGFMSLSSWRDDSVDRQFSFGDTITTIRKLSNISGRIQEHIVPEMCE